MSHLGRQQVRIDPIIFDQERATKEPPNRCLNGCSLNARDKNRGFESRPSRQFLPVGAMAKTERIAVRLRCHGLQKGHTIGVNEPRGLNSVFSHRIIDLDEFACDCALAPFPRAPRGIRDSLLHGGSLAPVGRAGRSRHSSHSSPGH